MLSVFLLIRILIYLLGNVLTIFSLYFLAKHRELHKNFRMAIFLLLLFGFQRALLTYCIAFFPYLVDPKTNEKLQIHFVAGFVYVICGFAAASLFLSLERCFAIYKPKLYERHSDDSLLAAGNLTTTVAITAILGYLANIYNTNQIPLLVISTLSGIISLVVAIIVWKRAKRLWNSRTVSLGQRFQIAEAARTSPIYLLVSANESCCITAMSVIGFLMLDRNNTDVIASDDFLIHLIDVIGGWRIVFINLTLVYYGAAERKIRSSVVADTKKDPQDSTAEHFTSLKSMWT